MLANTAKIFEITDLDIACSFTDQEEIASWAKCPVSFVSHNNIMNGIGDNYFKPTAQYTREQAFVTLLRLYDLIK